MLLHPIPAAFESEEDLVEVLENNQFIKIKQRSLRFNIIDFIKTLTLKVTPSPTLANFLFSDSRTG
jgi:hypothetical protein